jgi:transposase
MRYVGCDVHLKNTKVAWLDDTTGEAPKPYNVPTAKLGAHLREMAATEELQIALETSTTGYFVARLLRSLQLDATVVDAFKAKRLLEALRQGKTDALDAAGLAWLLAKGALAGAAVWVPDERIIELRELVRGREAAKQGAVRIRNQIRKLLNRHGESCPYSSLTGRKGRLHLDEVQTRLPKGIATSLTTYRGRLDNEAGAAKTLSRQIADLVAQWPMVKLLRTIPGVGLILAATIAAEIGDIARFASAANLRSYARLAPTVFQSGERSTTGPLNKHGNRLLSWALIEAAAHFSRSQKTRGSRPSKHFLRVALRRGPNPARVSLARHLAGIVFAMLRDATTFELARLMPARLE